MTRKGSSWEGQKLPALREPWHRPQVHVYSSIDSTSTMALKLAEEQTAGLERCRTLSSSHCSRVWGRRGRSRRW